MAEDLLSLISCTPPYDRFEADTHIALEQRLDLSLHSFGLS